MWSAGYIFLFFPLKQLSSWITEPHILAVIAFLGNGPTGTAFRLIHMYFVLSFFVRWASLSSSSQPFDVFTSHHSRWRDSLSRPWPSASQLSFTPLSRAVPWNQSRWKEVWGEMTIFQRTTDPWPWSAILQLMYQPVKRPWRDTTLFRDFKCFWLVASEGLSL